MKVTFNAIFMPPYTKSGSVKHMEHSYFIVTPSTYKQIIGFEPITNNEFFHLDDPSFGIQYFNKNSIDSEKVNMYAYELMFANKLAPEEQQNIINMVTRLETENKIKHINIEIELKNNVFF